MYWSGINPFKMLLTDVDMFWKFYPAAMTRMAVLRFTGHKLRNKFYAGHIVHNQKKGNELLKKLIESGKPFLFGRHGSNELFIAIHGLMLERGIISNIDSLKLDTACKHCGFFPNLSENYVRFNNLLIDASRECDLYGTFRMVGEDYYIKHFMKKCSLTHLNMMDFWRYEVPFTNALKGKKVLIVHPMTELIASQYKKREVLFKNSSVLPEFKLSTVKAVQTLGENRDPRFGNWFEALEFMENEVKKIDFDIALLGCGAYGMPLAAAIKRMGKQAIYMGGVLQMLFGIYGSRWDNEPAAKALKNEYWVRPDDSIKPKGYETVENGCYW